MNKTIKEMLNAMSTEDQRHVYDQLGETLNLQHSADSNKIIADIFKDAKIAGSLKDSILAHADEYGIDKIEELFPMPKSANGMPVILNNPVEWVTTVLNGVHKSPFPRVKTIFVDLTPSTLRAKGYVKGSLKVEDVITLLKRTTQPTTIYKKQKIDRDDMVDVTDFSIVELIKAEMRLKLDEEIARAILIGDGRLAEDNYKISEDCIKPIYNDEDLFTIKVSIGNGSNKAKSFVESVIRNRKLYKGSGTPKLFTTEDMISDLLLLEDNNGRRIYKSLEDIKAVLRVSDVVPVQDMEDLVRPTDDGKTHSVVAVLTNLADYSVGTNNGGQVALFDDFDIDYNQQKYLLETRCSGALTKPYSAMTFETVV